MTRKIKTAYQFFSESVREGGVDVTEYHCLMDFSGGESVQSRYELALATFEDFRKLIWPTFEDRTKKSGILSTAKSLFGIILKREGVQVLKERDDEIYARFAICVTPLNETDLEAGNKIMKDTLNTLGFKEI